MAISEADRRSELDYIATIHHGIDLDRFPYRNEEGGHLLFFGRIHPDKGTSDAIEVARRVGMRLVIAGIVQDEKYFKEQVEPLIDGSASDPFRRAPRAQRRRVHGMRYTGDRPRSGFHA